MLVVLIDTQCRFLSKNPAIVAGMAGSLLLRKAASTAFLRKKRSMVTSDIIEVLGDRFKPFSVNLYAVLVTRYALVILLNSRSALIASLVSRDLLSVFCASRQHARVVSC
jgi:predicted membrane protein